MKKKFDYSKFASCVQQFNRMSDIKKGRISGTTLSSAINIVTPPDPPPPKNPGYVVNTWHSNRKCKGYFAKKLQTPARTCGKA